MTLSSEKLAVSSSGTGLAADGLTFDQVIEAAIDHATEPALRHILLQAVDWSRIDAARVANIIAKLVRQKQSVPRTLVNAFLLAGHVVPVEMAQTPDQRVLNVLNEVVVKNEAAITGDLRALADIANIEPEIAQAIVARLVRIGGLDEACHLALAFWPRVPQALGPIRPKLASHLAALSTLRIRVAGFSTTHTFAIDLGPAFGRVGRNALIEQSDFGGAFAELLEPDAMAEAHILLFDFDSFAGADWRMPAPKIWDLLVARADMLSDALTAFARSTSAPLLINSIPVPFAPTAGLLDSRHISGLRTAVQLINRRLWEVAERYSNILVVDADHALADIASSQRHDPKLWFYGRIAYSADATRALACAFAEVWSLASHGPAKVLALDLDNTLWGGIYGDDGLERLVCGEDFPGNAFQAFQQECLRLKRQGFLLVALSKNNSDAITVFERHPGMVLKASDFAASAINWEPKPANIRRIASELNLGLDSFVFIDDSPHEREAMRRLAPEVIVAELPEDPAQRPSWLRRLVCTWPVRLTDEDERRSEMYAAEREARALKDTAVSIEDYLCGLQQKLTVSAVATDSIARVAQMHQRTNQFNLTTRRLTEADIAAYVEDSEHGLALAARVVDKFGDHGMVIAATISIDGSRAEIDTFLMSCRVIGREIERSFLAALVSFLTDRGVKRVIGRFVATAKNGMVRDFFSANGFVLAEGDERTSSWVFDMREQKLAGSQFVSLEMEA
ncbi:HAD-IIIC family phosphatase [Leptospira interrogans]